MEHTPTPWEYTIRGDHATWIIFHREMERAKNGFDVEVDSIVIEVQNVEESDLAYIVKACNHHEELVKALSLTIRTINDTLRHGLTAGQLDALDEVIETSKAILLKIEGA